MSNRTLFNCKVVMAGALLASVSWGRAMANDLYYSCGIAEQNVLQIQNQLKFVVNLPTPTVASSSRTGCGRPSSTGRASCVP